MVVRMEQLQAQTQVMAPQLRQSLKILQASALDLRAVIQEELQLNPTLEELPLDSVSLDTPKEGFEEQNSEFEDYEQDSKASQAIAAKHHEFLMESLTSEVSLQDHLITQIGCLDLSEELHTIASFIIGSLDEKGFLSLSLEEIARQTRHPVPTIQEALKVIHQLDPIGVGSKDVRSCLLLQLGHQNKKNSLAYTILDEYYPLLLKNKIVDIARHLNLSPEEIQDAINHDIVPLDPAPGRHYHSNPTQSIIPDVRIFKSHLGEWVVELNNDYIPRLSIGSTYKDMLSQSNVRMEDRNYLRLKIRSGRFLIQAILQRQKTIEQIAHALLHKQIDFFENGPSALKPLNLQALAETIGIHEATVSRATSNKYLETPFGLFSFKYFFTKGLNFGSGTYISNSIIKQQIQKIIEAEDRKKPLSDQKIVILLTQNGVRIARRTVTKYRELLGIPAASLRRKYD